MNIPAQGDQDTDETRREAIVVTAAMAWHDATCPEGRECRSRTLHGDPRSIPGVLGALTSVLDAVQADPRRLLERNR